MTNKALSQSRKCHSHQLAEKPSYHNVSMSPNIKSWQETIKRTEKGYFATCHPLDLICQETAFTEKPWDTEQCDRDGECSGLALWRPWLAPVTPMHLQTGKLGHFTVKSGELSQELCEEGCQVSSEPNKIFRKFKYV